MHAGQQKKEHDTCQNGLRVPVSERQRNEIMHGCVQKRGNWKEKCIAADESAEDAHEMSQSVFVWLYMCV